MLFCVSQLTICFIVCHGGPAEHFAAFVEGLSARGKRVEVYASGPAVKKLQERNIVHHPFWVDGLSAEEQDVLAKQIAQTCRAASLVITDVGHPFDLKIHEALAREIIPIKHFAYYDNPEPYVPGGYSKIAAKVMLAADAVYFPMLVLLGWGYLRNQGSKWDWGVQKKWELGITPPIRESTLLNVAPRKNLYCASRFFEKMDYPTPIKRFSSILAATIKTIFSKLFPFSLRY